MPTPQNNVIYPNGELFWPSFPTINRESMFKDVKMPTKEKTQKGIPGKALDGGADSTSGSDSKDPAGTVIADTPKVVIGNPVEPVDETASEVVGNIAEIVPQNPKARIIDVGAEDVIEIENRPTGNAPTELSSDVVTENPLQADQKDAPTDDGVTLDQITKRHPSSDSARTVPGDQPENLDEFVYDILKDVWDFVEIGLASLHLYEGTWLPTKLGDLLPWSKDFSLVYNLPLPVTRRTKLTEEQIELYSAHAPMPPSSAEKIAIRLALNVRSDFDEEVTAFLKQQKGQQLLIAGCDLYNRHIRSKRDQFLGPNWGPEPGTVNDENSSLTHARGPFISGMVFTPLFDAREYGEIIDRTNCRPVPVTRTGKSAEAPLIPIGAPIINGMQSLIKLDYRPGEHPVTRNTGYRGHCVKPLKDLEPVFLEDMTMDFRHEGKYFLCRVTSPPVVLLDISISVADQNGDSIRVGIHNTPIKPISMGMPTLEEYKAMFPINTFLIIKDPYLDDEACNPHISVASPTDIQIVGLRDSLVANVVWKVPSHPDHVDTVKHTPVSFDLAKSEAERLFGEKLYFQAERMCARALDDHPDHGDAVAVHLLRAEILMRLERWYQAEADAERVTELVLGQMAKGDVGKKKKKTLSVMLRKAMLISGMACYGRRAWKHAADAFERALQRFTDSEPLRQGLQFAKDRIKETETGVYDWSALHQAAKKGDMNSEIGDYVGPIEEKDFPGFGKGIVASRDVKAGEFLTVSRALAIIGRDSLELDLRSNRAWLMRILGYNHPFPWAWQQTLTYKAYWQPELNKQLQALYHGYENPPRPKFPFYDDSDYRGKETDPINAGDMDLVAAFNSFGVGVDKAPVGDESDVWADKTALHPLLCLFNNSCKPNCSLQRVGNVMGVRALEDIPAGEEVFVMYFPSVDYVYRCVKLERLMGIPCSCDHCKDEQKDGLEAYEKREKLRKELMKRVDKQDYPQPWVPLSQHKIYFKQRQERTMGEIAELMTTYGEHRDDYRPDMSVFWADLTAMSKLMSVRSQDPAEAKFYVESVFNMLRCEGVELTDDPKPKGRQRSVSQLKGLPIRTLPYGPSKSCIRALVDLSVHYSVTERDEKTSAVWWKVAETVALLTKTPSREVFERLYKPYRTLMKMMR